MGKITQKRRGRKGERTPLPAAKFVGGVDMKTPGCCLTWCPDQTVDICMEFWQCEGKSKEEPSTTSHPWTWMMGSKHQWTDALEECANDLNTIWVQGSNSDS